MIGVLFLYWISTRNAFSQNVTWTVGTSVPRFGDDLRLDCIVDSNCCTSHNRIWEIGTGTIILNNGIASSTDKYEEEWNGTTSGFTLIIKNLQQSDVEVEYNCRYRLSNDKHNLTQNINWEYVPNEPCPLSEKYYDFVPTSDFKFEVARSAPSPRLLAEIGGQKRTSGLTVAPANFGTWFYSLNVTIDVETLCGGTGEEDELFILSVTTGTTTKTVCSDIYLCFPCWRCGLICLAYTIVGLAVGCSLLFIFFCFGFSCCSSYWYTEQYFCMTYDKTDDEIGENCSKLYGKSYRNGRRNKAFIIAAVATIIGYITLYSVICALFLIGFNCPSCKGSTEIACLSFAGGVLVFLFNFQVALKIFNEHDEERRFKKGYLCSAGFVALSFLIIPIPIMILIFCFCLEDGNKDQKYLKQCLRFSGIVALSFLIIPIPIMILIHCCCLKGENSQSVESGSSCWPICRVGQDPNTSSSDPEKVGRSSKKESADKKPTGFVRPQPSRAQHLGTDNTGRAEYSAEDEMYSEKILKSNKPRLLPSIGQQTDSPRPLPQMPASAQQGGNQLAPLEKKKKKRKKKREAKQSDEENSTEL